MQLSGQILGYNKKTLALLLGALLIAASALYTGAKIEKNKLLRLGLLRAEACPTASSKKAKKDTKKDTAQTPIAETFSGSIIAKDAKGITLKTGDTSTLFVAVSPATTVSNVALGKPAALSLQQSVIVSGVKNADGTVSAQNIELVPTTK